MSHMLHITLPDMLFEALTRMARQTGQPLETVATKWLTVAAEQLVHDPLDQLIGTVASGGIDWANNHDQYVGQGIADELITHQS